MRKFAGFLAAVFFPVLLVASFLLVFQEHTQFVIGKIYQDGIVVGEDPAEAKNWYRKAAENGLAEAQNALGVMTFYGLGGPVEKAEALKWYRAAANQGHAEAQFNLAVMYSAGYGIWRDYVQALMWLQLAAAQGHEKAIGDRHRFERNMSADDISRARRLAAAWRKAHIEDK